jgi:hypothetical protein
MGKPSVKVSGYILKPLYTPHLYKVPLVQKYTKVKDIKRITSVH